jgi:hypothetical protein
MPVGERTASWDVPPDSPMPKVNSLGDFREKLIVTLRASSTMRTVESHRGDSFPTRRRHKFGRTQRASSHNPWGRWCHYARFCSRR